MKFIMIKSKNSARATATWGITEGIFMRLGPFEHCESLGVSLSVICGWNQESSLVETLVFDHSANLVTHFFPCIFLVLRKCQFVYWTFDIHRDCKWWGIVLSMHYHNMIRILHIWVVIFEYWYRDQVVGSNIHIQVPCGFLCQIEPASSLFKMLDLVVVRWWTW